VRRVFASTTSAPAYGYDPYGVPLQGTAPTTDFVYAGMFYNADSGLFLTNYRAFDPVAGRWLSRDPIGEPTDPYGNLYSYAVGNPVSLTDPFGLDSLFYSNGVLIHYDSEGNVVGIYDATSGVPGVTDPSIRNKGPIPPGQYTLNPKEISPTNPFRRLLGDWGEYRAPLHPNEGTNTRGRSGFFLHGGKTPGSAGCIDVGDADKTLFPELQKAPGPVPVDVW
jgi:RHS repeat-associated protein